MRELAERAYFSACLALGRLLRSATYSKTRIIHDGGEVRVRKHRVFYAPLLVWVGEWLVRLLDTGVRILSQSEWEERERQIYGKLYDTPIQADGVLVLPCLPGKTLATQLEDRALAESTRNRAIELSVVALANFHARGLTHGDAMAENVMVDLEAGVARLFDFETIHEATRSMAWRRCDDLRALLSTCLVRTPRGSIAETLERILDVYGDEEIARLLTPRFASVWRRALTFHLGQAALSFPRFREIARLLAEHAGRGA